MLAVCLGHLDAAKLLIEKGANVNTETDGWTCVQVGSSVTLYSFTGSDLDPDLG